MRIPYEKLSADVLNGIIQEFVLREGTEYGAHEVTLEEKVSQVKRQLERGEVCIIFDERDESCNIVPT